MAVGKTTTSNLDPLWAARIYSATTGEDFLGLRAVQTNITDYLLPGIITITPRARYYAFYSWVLVEYGESHPEGWSFAKFIRRREQIFALASFAHAEITDDNPGVAGLAGWQRLGRHWRTYRDSESVPLNAEIVKGYLRATYGGYNAYAGVMRVLGITRPAEGDDNAIDITPQGQRLARSFAEAIQDTAYYERRAEYDTATSIPRTMLEEYGSKCHLSYLAVSPDCEPTLEALFAFSAPQVLPPIGSDLTNRGNMRGTLGLILDMLGQATSPFTDDNFREAVAYGSCDDYDRYQPSPPLRPFLAHWQMFQLREYYVYALYALWVYFLHWLRLEGPQALQAFHTHLNETVDLAEVAAAIGITIPSRSPQEWMLNEWLDTLLDASEIPGDGWKSRCLVFAQKSKTPLNEHALYQLLDRTQPGDPATYVGVTWLLLSTLLLRLRGLRESDRWGTWYWARFGGVRRRSMDLFVREMSSHGAAGDSLLDTWRWLYRDYIVAQHTIAALEKWRQRKANTFHFNYAEGIFEWVQDDRTGFSASRFQQAYVMLADLGLYEIDPEEGILRLTTAGRRTFQRVLESCGG